MTSDTSTLTAISPNKSLIAIHSPPLENDDPTGSSQRVLIKCYDSKVKPGTLKFTLSVTSAAITQIVFPLTAQDTKPQFLLARTTTNSILIFDLSRGVLSHTIPLSKQGSLIHITGKDGHLYALLHNPKDSKVLVQIHDLISGKATRKVKFGSCPVGKVGAMTVHPLHNYVAVKMDTKLKVLDWKSGEKLKQFKKTSLETTSPESSKVYLEFVGDEGGIFFASSGSGLTLISTETGKILANIIEEDVIVSVDVRSSDMLKSLFFAVTTSVKVTLYQVHTPTKGETLKAFATMMPSLKSNQCAGCAYFVSGIRGDTEVALAEFTQKGMGNHVVDISVTTLDYIGPNGSPCSGELLNGKKVLISNEDTQESTSYLKKRKATNFVLGPGEDGGEALRVTDQKTKKTKGDDDLEDHNGFNLEESEDQEQTIAQRLALLSSELERDTEDDEDDHIRNEIIIECNNSQTKFNSKKATSESLVTLLRQALTSNDDSQLEVAFQVSDKKVIENSILALAADAPDGEEGTRSDVIVTLLSKLVTRLSRKPARAQALAFWVRNVLVALISTVGQDDESWKMGKKERDVAVKLGPLRNMLNERVECLPLLMRLEGRLALLGKM